MPKPSTQETLRDAAQVNRTQLAASKSAPESDDSTSHSSDNETQRLDRKPNKRAEEFIIAQRKRTQYMQAATKKNRLVRAPC